MDKLKYYYLKGKQYVVVEGDVLAWAEKFEVLDRRVAIDYVGDVRVSTVFLGLDHRFLPGGPPILFETMIFGGKFDQFQRRYTCWSRAKAGHQRALRRVREAAEGK